MSYIIVEPSTDREDIICSYKSVIYFQILISNICNAKREEILIKSIYSNNNK